MDFDNKNKIMTISYPNWDSGFNRRDHVKFEINEIVILTSHESCFEVIYEFLKQFQFTM